MRSELRAIQQIFERPGWIALSLPASEPLQAAFKSSYALVGILVAESVSQVLETWESAQEKVREIRSSDPNLRDNDAYLVILLPRVDTGADHMREVLNNTYVCRKLCIEMDGKTVEKALEELPFFAVLPTNDKSILETDMETSNKQLPESLLEDLGKASAEVVLDGLLEEKYSRGGGG